MRIQVSRTFIDLQASDPANAEVPAGTQMTVSDARGAELIEHGVAEQIKPARGTRKPSGQAQPPAAATPDIDAAAAPTT